MAGLLWLVAAGVLDSAVGQGGPPQAAEPDAGLPELVLQTEHFGTVLAVAMSPDGKWIATGGADNAVRIWNVASGHLLRTLVGHTKDVGSLAVSPDGRNLASGGADGAAKVWDIASGRELHTFQAIEAPVIARDQASGLPGEYPVVAFSADGRTLATTGGLRSMLWDLSTGRQLAAWQFGGKIPSRYADLAASATPNSSPACAAPPCAASRDGRWLVQARPDQALEIREVFAGRIPSKTVRTLRVSSAPAPARRDPDERLEPAARRASSAQTGRRAVAVSPDGRWLAIHLPEGALELWDLTTGGRVRTATSLEGRASALAFAPAGRSLVAATPEQLKLWEVATGQELASTQFLSRPSAFVSGDPNVRRVDETGMIGRFDVAPKVVVSPDGRWLAHRNVADIFEAQRVQVWDVQAGRALSSLPARDQDCLWPAAFSHDGRLLATMGQEGVMRQLAPRMEIGGNRIQIWDLASGRKLRSFGGDSERLTQALALSPDGRWLASGGAERTTSRTDAGMSERKAKVLGGLLGGAVRLGVGTAMGKATGSMPSHTSGSSPEVKVSPHLEYQPLKLWDAASGREVRTLKGHQGSVDVLVFSPDSRYLASGASERPGKTSDDAVKIWEVATGQEMHSLAGHGGGLDSVAFSPDGRWLVSRSGDGATRIWDPASGRLLATLLVLPGGADWLVVTPDGLFDSSPGAWSRVLWRFNQNTFETGPVELFFSEFYYPGLLTEVVSGRNPKAPRSLAQLDRRQPEVRLTLADPPVPAGQNVATRTVTVRLEVGEGGAGSGARDLRLFRNGSLVRLWRGDLLQAGQAALEASVPIVAGENRLTAYAFNRDNVKSADAALVLTGAASLQRSGTAYILAVGINQYANAEFNLQYAVADAQALVAEFERSQRKLGQFNTIEVVPLLNQQATRANILLALDRLAGRSAGALPAGAPAALDKLKPSQPEDAVAVYFAGHGAAQGGRFYLVPHDLGYAGPRAQLDAAGLQRILAQALSDRALEQAFERIDAAHLLLIIDACHSGQALAAEERRRGPMNSKGLAQLAYEKGMYILAAAQSYQAALEVEKLGHGYLTYALVEEGLKSPAADQGPTDGQVVAREWLDYATLRVPAMQAEKIDQARQAGRDLAFVEGEQKTVPADKRSVQRPRVFYRRDPESRPLVVVKPEAKPPGS